MLVHRRFASSYTQPISYRPAWRLCLKLLEIHEDVNTDVFERQNENERENKEEKSILAPLSKSNTTIRIASALVRNVKTLAKTAAKGAINVRRIKNKLLAGGVPNDFEDEGLVKDRMMVMLSGFSATTWEMLMGHCLWGCDAMVSVDSSALFFLPYCSPVCLYAMCVCARGVM